MAYSVSLSDGTVITIANSTNNDETNLNLLGQNYPGYGQLIAENFVRLTENFADDVPPGDPGSRFTGLPVKGQIWYDTVNTVAKYYDGTSWIPFINEDSNINGNAATATALQNPVNFSVTGAALGTLGYMDNAVFTPSNFDGTISPMEFRVSDLDADSLSSGTVPTARLTGTYNVDISGNSATASAWETARTLSLAGAVTGSVSIDGSGNVTLNTTATSDPTLTIDGDATGTATFTNLGDATLTLEITDNSHSHTIANVTGLQSALDAKLDVAGGSIINGNLFVTGNGTTTGGLQAEYITSGRYDTTSDISLKDVYGTLVPSNRYGIESLRIKLWKWADNENVPEHLRGSEDSGVIAQEVEQIPELRHCIHTDPVSGIKRVDYGKLAVHLILLKG